MTGTSRAMAADVLIVGGGAAGLTAAIVLARAQHRGTVIDDQTHRNATVDEFHGFPTRDATAPRFRMDALAELNSYHVTIIRAAVTSATSTDGNLSMTLTNGTTVHGARHCEKSGHGGDKRPDDQGIECGWLADVVDGAGDDLGEVGHPAVSLRGFDPVSALSHQSGVLQLPAGVPIVSFRKVVTASLTLWKSKSR
jgi:hypothetical protein